MKKALVVGINDYPKSPLHGCINDAESIGEILGYNEDGSRNFGAKIETNVTSKSQLKGYIQDCFSGDSEIALFYYSGHGYIDSLGGYIVTPDYCKNDMGVSMQDILSIVNKSKCSNKVVILDCCNSGDMGNSNTTSQSATTIENGVTILTACRFDESAIESSGHGVFTSLLLEALSGGAADVTGHITPGGIYAYIDKALGPWDQRPVFKTNVTLFSSLRKVKSQVSMEILRKIPTYFKESNSEFNLDPSFEPTNNLTVKHDIIEPYTKGCNAEVFSDLQKLEGVGLVEPCDEEHMYFAAMHSKSCKLTAVGQQYWKLAKNRII